MNELFVIMIELKLLFMKLKIKMKKITQTVGYFAFTILFSINSFAQNTASKLAAEQTELKTIILSFIESFLTKIDSSYVERVNILLQDGATGYSVLINKKKEIFVTPGVDDEADISFRATIETYRSLYNGEMNAMTAMAQARGTDPVPLNYSFGSHLDWNDQNLNRLYFLGQRFFNVHACDKILLTQDNARIVHGAHAIPIFYRRSNGVGVRSAWYQLSKGQRSGRPGEVNPFPQVVIVISGRGMATIGNDTFILKPGEAYYIAPFLDHYFWNEEEEPAQVIWLAWELTGGN
jgi:hypothetical protein